MKSKGIHFGAYGPFIIGRQDEPVTSEDLKNFWEAADHKHPGIARAKGVYIAAIWRGKNKRLYPVYIGKTDTRFKGRLTEKHHLFELAKVYEPRRLRVFFLARMESEGGSFKLATRRKGGDGRGELVQSVSIQRLEFELIGKCVRAGFPLFNTQYKAFHTAFNVAGFVGKTRAGDRAAADEIRNLLKPKRKST